MASCLLGERSSGVYTSPRRFGALLIANIKDYFPRRVGLEPDNVLALGGVVVLVCLLASALGVRAALKADPATALGG